MKSIATRYKGRLYRSRLETRWASFFDILGWPYEYEPFDLNGWIPDFILLGAHSVLVEVKPTTIFLPDVAEKIERSGAEHEVLIVGCTVPVKPYGGCGGSTLVLGWLAERAIEAPHAPDEWGDAVLGLWNDRIGFCHDSLAYTDRISGEHMNCHGWPELSPYRVMNLWADAGNRTQWKAPTEPDGR